MEAASLRPCDVVIDADPPWAVVIILPVGEYHASRTAVAGLFLEHAAEET